jgi:hypothetical protein
MTVSSSSVSDATVEKNPTQPGLALSRRSASSRRTAAGSTIGDPAYFYSSLLAGIGSGALASVFIAPLDLVRTRMQVWGQVLHQGKGSTKVLPSIVQGIMERDGFKGFFRGLGATLLTVPAFWGVYCESVYGI